MSSTRTAPGPDVAAPVPRKESGPSRVSSTRTAPGPDAAAPVPRKRSGPPRVSSTRTAPGPDAAVPVSRKRSGPPRVSSTRTAPGPDTAAPVSRKRSGPPRMSSTRTAPGPDAAVPVSRKRSGPPRVSSTRTAPVQTMVPLWHGKGQDRPGCPPPGQHQSRRWCPCGMEKVRTTQGVLHQDTNSTDTAVPGIAESPGPLNKSCSRVGVCQYEVSWLSLRQQGNFTFPF